MAGAFAPEQLEKSARNLLACAKWLQKEKRLRMEEGRPSMREQEIDQYTRAQFRTNWGSAYNALKILECLGEEYIERAIAHGIAFSALYAFTHEEDARAAFEYILEMIAQGEITGRPSHDKIADYLAKHPVEMRQRQQDDPAELSELDALLSPYQTRVKPYVKPKHSLMLMRTPSHISRGRRAIVDSKNALDEESLSHMKLFIVAQASNGRVYISHEFTRLTTDHLAHGGKEWKDREAFLTKRCAEIRHTLEDMFKKHGWRLVKAEEILTASRAHISKFLQEQHYLVGGYKEK